MAAFRNPAARDQAWARFYARRGLRPVLHEPRSMPNTFRIAAYHVRRAQHDLARAVVRL